MNILDRILADKKIEVSLKKKGMPESNLRTLPLFTRTTSSLAKQLQNSSSGIIAEHKRRSPSKSVINQDVKLWEVAKAYQAAGVSGISVLTDTQYFGGALQDLLMARSVVDIPILRKDFILDPYQLVEAKAHGADVILLIAAALEPSAIRELAAAAKELQLEVLLEVHNLQELESSWVPGIQMLGVNNRNLKTFEVNLDTSREIASHIPTDVVAISESGIYHAADIQDLRGYGYKGFLVGEQFMKEKEPGMAATSLIQQLSS